MSATPDPSVPSALLSVPSSVTTPLSLAALTVVVLYLVYKLIFENRLLTALGTHQTSVLLGRIVNWVGLLALVALVLTLAPTAARIVVGGSSPSSEIDQRLNVMWANYDQGLYDESDRAADRVLELDHNNFRALNMKGIVAFYKGQYEPAAEYFSQALKFIPGDRSITKNLADAYVETGAYKLAIDTYESISDNRPDWLFGKGRAYLYSGEYQEAIKYFEAVPSDYYHGSARVLEAAALVGLGKQSSSDKQAGLVSAASAKLREGIAQDPHYWRGIFDGKERDIHEDYSKPKQLLEGLYESEIQAQS